MRLVAVVAAVLLVAGCADKPSPTHTPGPAGTGAPSKAPEGKGNPGRIFAPDREGLPYYAVKEAIEDELREQCGGSLCVKIKLAKDRKSDPNGDDCVFRRAEPKEVQRGGTFTFYLSSLDCDPPPSPTE
ncbi:MAG TPA: hypothetical protein VM677_21580 [Actinokineospora sp.]|jgi:hypothetical protein|nr:hypothetical protein [Actinokineospora sp.]